MTIGMLLDMAVASHGDRVVLGSRDGGLTTSELADQACRGAAELRRRGPGSVAFLGVSSPAVPVTVLAAALAELPMVPLNYRLAPATLRTLLAELDRPVVIADAEFLDVVDGDSSVCGVWCTDEWLSRTRCADQPDTTPLPECDDHAVAVQLFTSGTSSAPKRVLLRHSHLVSYVLQTVELGSADQAEATLVSVPPYHVAGLGAVLSNLFAGRRVVYLPNFDATGWLAAVSQERITSAMLVPTMLARIVEHLDGARADTPTLRSLAYGGARVPPTVLEAALRALPTTAFTNAYGLTETSSTIAVLGPEDHRAALDATDPTVRDRLASAGRFVPGVEGQIRDPRGIPLGPDDVGELWVRGPQVSGEYACTGSSLDENGWFPTRDRARLDADGYLFVEGRADDTIIRGGENIAPAEIEDVLLRHPGVADAAVVGAADTQWGQRIVAVLVLRPDAPSDCEMYRAWVRDRLRSSRTPDRVMFSDHLPYSATGKLIRRELVPLAAQL